MELIQLLPYLVSSYTCRGGGRKKIILENYHRFFLIQPHCLCFLTPDCICYGNVFGFSTLISCFPSFSCWCSSSLSWSHLTWSAVMNTHMYDDQWYLDICFLFVCFLWFFFFLFLVFWSCKDENRQYWWNVNSFDRTPLNFGFLKVCAYLTNIMCLRAVFDLFTYWFCFWIPNHPSLSCK